MKQLLYFILLLALIIATALIIIKVGITQMSMPQMVSIFILLVFYVIGISFAGEQPSEDEREQQHKYLANRTALRIGTGLLAIGILYQLYTHQFDFWLLIPLIGINLTKIISLLYLYYRK